MLQLTGLYKNRAMVEGCRPNTSNLGAKKRNSLIAGLAICFQSVTVDHHLAFALSPTRACIIMQQRRTALKLINHLAIRPKSKFARASTMSTGRVCPIHDASPGSMTLLSPMVRPITSVALFLLMDSISTSTDWPM